MKLVQVPVVIRKFLHRLLFLRRLKFLVAQVSQTSQVDAVPSTSQHEVFPLILAVLAVSFTI